MTVTDDDIERAKRRLELAMRYLSESETASVERNIQHAHAALEGKIEELYIEYDDITFKDGDTDE